MSTHITPGSPAGWRPDQTAYLPGDVIPDAILLQASTVVGQIEGDAPSIRVPYVGDDGAAGFVAEGAPIGESGHQFNEVVVQTAKIAVVGKYSFETLAQPQAAKLVTESLARAVMSSGNAAFLGNAADADGPTGLLNAGVTDGGEILTNLDPVVDAVAGIEGDGGTATHIVTGPDAWAAISKLKRETQSNESLVGAGTAAPQRLLLGLPVLVDKAMPAGGVLVLDRTAVVSAASQLRLARSEDAFFSSDVVAIKLAWRIGWSVQRPNRVVKLTTTPAAAARKR